MSGPPPEESREARLAAALRANLRRRKAQARGRAEGDAPPGAPDAPDAQDAQDAPTGSAPEQSHGRRHG